MQEQYKTVMSRRMSLAFLGWLSATSRFRRAEDPDPPAFFLLGGLSPAWLKRAIWNFKYRSAVPNGRSPASAVRYITTHFGPTTRLLDVGCGPGTFLRELREAGWTGRYTGLDISDRAVRTAKLLCDGSADWIVGNIEAFKTEECWDVICFIEAVYYIPTSKLAVVLRRLSEHLSDEGCVIIRVWNWARHRDHIRELYHCCTGFETGGASDTIVCITKSQFLF